MTATIIGATGLIGNHLMEELLQDDYFDTVKILIRKPLGFSHPRLEKKLVDFNDNDSLLIAIDNSDVVFCAVGTTQKKVKGDKAAYRKVDYDIPVHAARFCKMTGCPKFIYVSAVGANSLSKNFYLQLKGEVEDEIKKLGIRSVHVFQPSILLGKRKEFRLGEKIGKGLMVAFSLLVPSRYKAINASEVAKAMCIISKEEREGFFVYEYKSIMTILSK